MVKVNEAREGLEITMSRVFPPQAVAELGVRLFTAAGARLRDADVTVTSLVTSSLMGHDSHGIMRLPGYTRALVKGDIKPVGNHQIVRETPASLTIDVESSFWIVMN